MCTSGGICAPVSVSACLNTQVWPSAFAHVGRDFCFCVWLRKVLVCKHSYMYVFARTFARVLVHVCPRVHACWEPQRY